MTLTTAYRGAQVETSFKDRDDQEDPTLWCPSDACPALEAIVCDDCHGRKVISHGLRDDQACEGCDGAGFTEVIRLSWDGGAVRASGPTYGCGGEPGFLRFPECPTCGESGEGF